MDTEDLTLVERLRARDEEALGAVYARFHGALFRFLLRLSGNRAVAEDLFQETWLAVARDASRLREGSDLEAWLFTVARNRYRSHRRAAFFDLGRVFGLGRERAPLAPSPEEEVGAAQDARRVEAALAELSPALREVLLLCQGEGLAVQRAAEVLGLTPATARQRLHRAREALAAALGAGHATAEEG